MIVAHANSLRGIVKLIDGLGTEEIQVGLIIPAVKLNDAIKDVSWC